MNARVWWLLALVWAALPAAPVFSQATADSTLSPYFLLDGASDTDVEPFTLEATSVRASVNGVIADVTVEQTYRNGGTRPINARYVFPASTRAAVHALQIQVAGKRVVAKIKARDEAAAEFKQATASGKTASLLEQERPNVFSMSVANILPADQVVVELRYSELLVPSDGVYQFVYPTVVGPRYATATNPAAPPRFVKSPYLPLGDQPDTRFALEVQLSTGVPLADLHSSTHKLNIAWQSASLARVSLAAGQGFAGNRDFMLEYRLTGTQIQSGLLLYEGEHENHFLFMVQPPTRVRAEDIAPREYVFVLDVSGSMSGFPLDTAKALIADLIGQLRPSDTFNVLLFSGDSRLMAARSVAASHANVERAIELIDSESAGGGTELEAALRQVIALPRAEHVSRSVIVLTDGYIAQERAAFELIAQNLARTNVFAFGIGSSVNRYLIEGLARVGQGEPFVVTQASEAAAVALRFRQYIEAPLLTEIGVRFHGFDAYDIEPTQQADLFAERPVVVFGKWRGPRAGDIEVFGRGASGAFSKTLSVAQTVARPENAALPQLWARTRIARLSDFDVDGHDATTVRQVTALGLQYSLLTKHTSFIAVLEQLRNPGGQADDAQQPLPLPQGVSDAAVGGEYASGSEPELVPLLGLLLLAVACGALRKKLRAQRSTP